MMKYLCRESHGGVVIEQVLLDFFLFADEFGFCFFSEFFEALSGFSQFQYFRGFCPSDVFEFPEVLLKGCYFSVKYMYVLQEELLVGQLAVVVSIPEFRKLPAQRRFFKHYARPQCTDLFGDGDKFGSLYFFLFHSYVKELLQPPCESPHLCDSPEAVSIIFFIRALSRYSFSQRAAWAAGTLGVVAESRLSHFDAMLITDSEVSAKVVLCRMG